MLATEQAMNRTPTAIALPLYDLIVSRLRCRTLASPGDAPHHRVTLGRPFWVVVEAEVPTSCLHQLLGVAEGAT
jgi:hypothetical protein